MLITLSAFTDPLEQFSLSSSSFTDSIKSITDYYIASSFWADYVAYSGLRYTSYYILSDHFTKDIPLMLFTFKVFILMFFGKGPFIPSESVTGHPGIAALFLGYIKHETWVSKSIYLMWSKLNYILLTLVFIHIYIYYSVVGTLLTFIKKSNYSYRFFSITAGIYNKTVKLVFSILKNTLNNIEHQTVFIWFFYLFLALIYSNLIGLTPASFTPTASLLIAVNVAATYFLALNIITLILHKFMFSSLFLPSDTPLLILPFLFSIEVISYYARVASLSIRCFANLMSGHTLMHILTFVVFSAFSSKFPYYLFLAIPAAIILAISFLELSIGIMQAGIFLVLLGIYYNSMISLH